MFSSIEFNNFTIQIIDQLKLPNELSYLEITSISEAWLAINRMNIRGAPALASLATLSIAQKVHNTEYSSIDTLKRDVKDACDYLYTSRPTAVNLGIALDQVRQSADIDSNDLDSVKQSIINQSILIWSEDVERNKKMSDNGAIWLINHLESTKKIDKGGKISILTICNTGSLATSVSCPLAL